MNEPQWEFSRYSRPDDVGYLGALNVQGVVIAFVDLSGRVQWVADIERRSRRQSGTFDPPKEWNGDNE